ncbi:MAG: hypothetical protein ACRC6E_05965, partial [Fusobacteriaceae bacterium]
MTYEEILQILPSELQTEGNATNMKALLKMYASIAGEGDKLNEDYGKLLDLYYANGVSLDFIGSMFLVFRTEKESDSLYRTRILKEISMRKTPTSLIGIQEAIDAIVGGRGIDVMENY